MTPKLKILENVIERMRCIREHCIGGLYGIMYERTVLVVGMSIATSSRQGVESYLKMQKRYPTGIDFCGIVSFQNKVQLDPPEETIKNLKEVLVTDNPVFLHKSTELNDICSYFFCNGRLSSTEFQTMYADEFSNTFVSLRLKAGMELTTQMTPKKITRGIEELQKKISSGGTVFQFQYTDCYVFSGDFNGDYGCSSNYSLGELYDSAPSVKDCRLQKGILDVVMLLQSSHEMFEDKETHAPLIKFTIDCSEKISMKIPINALCLAHKSRLVNESYGLLIDTVCRSFHLFYSHMIKLVDEPHKISDLRQYHFAPSFLGHFVTLIYPKSARDEELRDIRENMHKQLCISMRNPTFRKGNCLIFGKNSDTSGPLLNIHEGIKTSGVKGGKIVLVQGFYGYYHYMQDNFDDGGWGCAYRSLQTLYSWFRWQGYTDKDVPSHRDIQKCLIDIKDKKESFLGSHQWIGSTEVAFCLEAMLGISSRIIPTSSGSELDRIGNELLYHFEIQGTPIMIGGGVLAHTILGVHYNQDSGEIKFLVLDPHYSGSDDPKIIQNRGWVGWKGKDFWDKKVFYNLCLPQKLYGV